MNIRRQGSTSLQGHPNMTTKAENQNKVNAARAAITAHQQATKSTHDELEEAVIDLLTDLRHLLVKEGKSIQRVTYQSQMHQLTEQVRTHDGFSNEETRTVYRTIANDKQTHQYWMEQAVDHFNQLPLKSHVQERIWNAQEAAIFFLADQIQRSVQKVALSEDSLVYSDLQAVSLPRVNWPDIAGAILDDAVVEDWW